VSDELDRPLRAVVGDRTAKALASGLGVETVRDLLHHYPRRYAERGELTDLADLRIDEHVTVMAEVMRVGTRRMRNRRGTILEVVVGDGRRTLSLTFFNQPWREKDLRVGRRALFAGKVGAYRNQRQLVNPEYHLVDEISEGEAVLEFAGSLIPVYPATAVLPSWQVAKGVRVVLDLATDAVDPLPRVVQAQHALLPLGVALNLIHAPASWDDVRAARRRLKFDEAFLLQVALAQRRAAARRYAIPPRVRRSGGLVDAFEAMLPFTLTDGQRAVCEEIDADLAATHPMSRLLQGEVGSGKTVVALRAMLTVADSGGQAALMAPTEVLAAQHYRNVRDLLGPVGRAGELDAAEAATRVVLLTGSTPAAQRRAALDAIFSGEAGIVIGTHALIEGQVDFRDLALVVVDEQHRFGVEQRDTLRAKGLHAPHVLVMTATPIPRTVAMTVYGDLEVSTLRELPRGRTPIRTYTVPASDPVWFERVWARIRTEVEAGHQAFVVCPRIGGDVADDTADEPVPDDGDTSRPPMVSVEELLPMVRDDFLPGLRVEALHGRMAPDLKDGVMQRFAAGAIDVLVATTVVEVGVDVPNATVMVVMDADRFGISQLHQLRGRVGRGSAEGWCLLVTTAEEGTPARERVDVVAGTSDGFELARADLQQRREGDVLGSSQAGRRSTLRLLELLKDEELILEARAAAAELVDSDPELLTEPALAAAVRTALDEQQAEYLEKG
jgi:ATP-dependent DNA helicase RecG